MLDLTPINLQFDRPNDCGSLLERELCAMKDYAAANLSSFCENATNYAGETVALCAMACLAVYAAKRLYKKRD